MENPYHKRGIIGPLLVVWAIIIPWLVKISPYPHNSAQGYATQLQGTTKELPIAYADNFLELMTRA